jgi:hypothetical protein
MISALGKFATIVTCLYRRGIHRELIAADRRHLERRYLDA